VSEPLDAESASWIALDHNQSLHVSRDLTISKGMMQQACT
jgi:glutamine amidotransferase